MRTNKLTLVAHSHPVDIKPIASDDDRLALRLIGQYKSIVVSAVSGMEREYTADNFEMPWEGGLDVHI